MSAEREQKTVTLTIDGREIVAPEGELIIRAAERAGTYIPRFCDHPYLAPLGACRQCLVEVEGQRKPLTACTAPVADGMVVKTQHTSELAEEAQRGVLELLLINHPLDCPQCDKGGECPLQDQAFAYGPGVSRFIDEKRRYQKPIPINPLVLLDRERCVLCARCTRFAGEISGDPFIELLERGALEQVATYETEPYLSPFSGNVIQICPVGALTSDAFRFQARPFDMTSAPSTCTQCASGCSITFQERRGEIVRVLAAENPDVNDAWTCDKGRFGWGFVRDPERVTEPLVRKNGELVAVSWPEAIQAAAEGLASARDAGGVGVLAGGRLADEDAYALSRFARTALGTNDVDARLRPGSDEEDAVLAAVVRGAGATYADIEAAKLVVVAGLDAREESPIVFLRLRKALTKRGARIIEVGPRRTAFGAAGAAWIATGAGAEALVLAGAGPDGSALDEAASAAGGAVVVLAGERLAASPGALTAAWNLAVRSGGRFGYVPRRAGARGALNAGLHPALLPGGRRVDDAGAREAVEALWGPVPAAPGRDAAAILSDAGSLGALVLAGADPAADFPDASLGAAGVAAAPFVVALDMFLTESSRHADVVLPVAATPEREGTISNWEGRPGDFRPAVDPAGLTQCDWEVVVTLASALGVPFPATRAALAEEMAQLAPEPAEAAPLDGPAGAPEAPGPFTLVTYPALIDDGTLIAGANELRASAVPSAAEIAPSDAERIGVVSGDTVAVSVKGTTIRLPARVTSRVAPGTVVIPATGAGVRTQALRSAATPLTGVHVERAGGGA